MLLLLLLLYWLTEYIRCGASLQTLEKLFSCPITTLSTWCLVTGAEPVHSGPNIVEKKVFAEPGDRTKDYLIYAQMLYRRATSMVQIYKEQPSNNHCFCVNFHTAVKTVEDF